MICIACFLKRTLPVLPFRFLDSRPNHRSFTMTSLRSFLDQARLHWAATFCMRSLRNRVDRYHRIFATLKTLKFSTLWTVFHRLPVPKTVANCARKPPFARVARVSFPLLPRSVVDGSGKTFNSSHLICAASKTVPIRGRFSQNWPLK